MRKRLLVGVVGVSLIILPGLLAAQDKAPDKAAIVESFKAKMLDVWKDLDCHSGISQAKLEKASVSTGNVVWYRIDPARRNRGALCTDKHHRDCVQLYELVDGRRRAYQSYTPLKNREFGVTSSDSLVTPYVGVLRFYYVTYVTSPHLTSDWAEGDSDFHNVKISSYVESDLAGFTETIFQVEKFGYHDGQWELSDTSCFERISGPSVLCK